MRATVGTRERQVTGSPLGRASAGGRGLYLCRGSGPMPNRQQWTGGRSTKSLLNIAKFDLVVRAQNALQFSRSHPLADVRSRPVDGLPDWVRRNRASGQKFPAHPIASLSLRTGWSGSCLADEARLCFRRFGLRPPCSSPIGWKRLRLRR